MYYRTNSILVAVYSFKIWRLANPNSLRLCCVALTVTKGLGWVWWRWKHSHGFQMKSSPGFYVDDIRSKPHSYTIMLTFFICNIVLILRVISVPTWTPVCDEETGDEWRILGEKRWDYFTPTKLKTSLWQCVSSWWLKPCECLADCSIKSFLNDSTWLFSLKCSVTLWWLGLAWG